MTEASRPLAAMILSAGLGTRLRPLTDVLPKPLVWIGDRPAISSVLSSMAAVQPSRIVINSFYNAPKIAEFVRLSGVPLALSEEATLLGTAGGVARAYATNLLPRNSEVLVWNGDILSDLDAAALAEAHRTEPTRLATLAVRTRASGEGSVGIDAEGRIVRLRATTVGGEAKGADFLGVSILSERCLELLPKEGCLVGDAWIPALLRGETLRAFATDASTCDIGSIEAYAEANFRFLERHANAGVGPGASYVGEGAEVTDLHRSVVGARAVVRGPVRNSIVWPGVVQEGPLEDVIAGPGFRVPLSRRS